MVTCDLKVRAGRLRRPAASAHRDAVNTPFADGATCFATLVEITFFLNPPKGRVNERMVSNWWAYLDENSYGGEGHG